MTDDLRVSVLSPYPFHMVDQARELHKNGVLERMVTAVPRSRVGLPSEKVSNRLYLSGLWYFARNAVPRAAPAMNRTIIRDFDRWAVRHLGSPTVVNGLSGLATNTLEAASRRGSGVCCDRGSWHILEQKQVLDDEAEHIGCPRARFEPFGLERELREYELADRILVPSEQARQSFIRRGIDPAKVAKVPFGVDISAFTPPTDPRRSGAIVSVGTVGMRKGHRYLVDAFRSLPPDSASLTLVGPVENGWAERLDFRRGDVRAVGAVPRHRVIDELQNASVFVLASLEEGLALVIAQAMACGLPVIATEATGVRELVTDGVEGLIVAPGDSEALAEALEQLLADPERATEMGRAARQRVESFGGWDRYGRQVVDVFRAVHEARS